MKGSYVLLLELPKESEIQVGKLGRIKFPQGAYAYVGSAMGRGESLENRVARHERIALEKSGNLKWHIDYLTTSPNSRLSGVLKFAGKDIECSIAKLAEKLGGKCIAPKFGSSDCGCKTHLFMLDGDALSSLMRELPEAFD